MCDAIISIKPKHVESILSGKKTVELRVRNVNLPEGTRLWIYTTLPIGQVGAHAEVGFIECLSPKEMWRKYGGSICISKQDFEEYTKSREIVTAIGLKNVRRLSQDICLKAMRSCEENFQPPQFFTRLHPERELYKMLHSIDYPKTGDDRV